LNCLVLAAAFLSVFLVGRRAGAAPRTPMRGLGLHVLSLVPIAIGFHLAHYLPKLFFDWRHALRALSDPFGRGWDLLGVSAVRPSSSMALDHAAVTAIYNLQTALVVLAHMMAVSAAHRLVTADAISRRAALLRQLPMTVFMIAYTVYGLWLLSTPVIG
jgi:hypothetical protein